MKRRTDIDPKKLERMLKAGKSDSAVARYFKVHPSTIWHRRKRLQIPNPYAIATPRLPRDPEARFKAVLGEASYA